MRLADAGRTQEQHRFAPIDKIQSRQRIDARLVQRLLECEVERLQSSRADAMESCIGKYRPKMENFMYGSPERKISRLSL